MADEKICNPEACRLLQRVEVCETRLNSHSERINNLQLTNSRTEVIMDNLNKKIDNMENNLESKFKEMETSIMTLFTDIFKKVSESSENGQDRWANFAQKVITALIGAGVTLLGMKLTGKI